MMKLLKKTLYTLILCSLLIAGLLAFLLTSTPGLYALLRIAQFYTPGTLTLHQLSGSALRHYSIGQLEYVHKDLHVKAQKVQVDWNLYSLFQHQLTLNQLTADSVELNQGSVSQVLNQVQLKGVVNPIQARIDQLSFYYFKQEITALGEMGMTAPHPLSGQIKINYGSFNPLKPKGTINIQGTIKQLEWQGELTSPTKVTFKGSLNDTSKLIQEIQWRDFIWKKSDQKSVSIPQGSLHISGTLPNLTIALTTQLKDWEQQLWALQAKLQGSTASGWNLEALLNNQNPATSPGVHTRISAQGVFHHSKHAELKLTIAPGHYQMSKDQPLPSFSFEGGELKTTLSAKELTTQGQIKLDPQKSVTLAFKLPDFHLDEGFSPQQTLSGTMALNVNSLDFLNQLSPEITTVQGRLTAELKAKGTLDKPKFNSSVILHQVQFAIPHFGIHIDSFDLKVLSKKDRWEGQGMLASADKQIQIKGSGPLDKSKTGTILVDGSDVLLINTDEYQLRISPHLQLQLNPQELNITGTVDVPYALIKPHSFNNSVSLSEDIVYKSQQKSQPRSVFPTRMDVKVNISDKTEVNAKGLHAFLGGIVRLQQEPQEPVRATGDLLVKQGQYKAYGQDLTIEQGQLLYTGGAVDNPGINLKAAKLINLSTLGSNPLPNVNLAKIRVGVEVTGQLTAPRLLLFSMPAVLSQADILSMLVLGKPASQANKAGGQLLMTALTSMDLGSDGSNGAQLIEQLKQSLGIDFNVETNSNYNQKTKQTTENTSFVVGKALSKKLYLSYNVGLSQADPNVLTLKYILTRFFSLQVSSSDSANGIDLLYSRSKD